MSARITTVAVRALGVLTGALVAGALPLPAEPVDPAEESRGAVLYRLHCASCHGSEGKGDGPIAKELKTTPSDLTRIAARRGGRFSADEVERLIDGRSELEAHGTSDMPIWGLSFRESGRVEDQEDEIWLQIRQLVSHLRSIQKGRVREDGARR